jgi:arylsulfatase A-like enzyme
MAGPYGNRWIDTPNFDILATQGVVFDWHFSARPSQPLLDTVFSPGWNGPAPLADALGEARVATHLILDTSRSSQRLGSAGWSSIRECPGPRDAARQAARLLKKLQGEERWLAWVELASLLPPWEVDEAYLEQAFDPGLGWESQNEEDQAGMEELQLAPGLQPILDPTPGPAPSLDDATYLRAQATLAAAVLQADALIGEILDGLPDDVTLILTSDQGYPLGERGWIGPGGGLYDVRTHVPLITLGPGWPSGWRVSALTSSEDLASTIAGHFLLPDSPATGEPLQSHFLGLAQPGSDPRALLLMADEARALRTARWLLHLPREGKPELYEKPADRYDQNDLSGPRFEVVEELTQALNELTSSGPAP